MVAVAVVKLFFRLQMKEVGLEWQPKDHFAVAPQEDWVPGTGMNNLVQQRMRKKVFPKSLIFGFEDSTSNTCCVGAAPQGSLLAG